MIKQIRDMYFRFEETINYLFFGGLAFFVNMGAYKLAAWVLGADNEKVALVLAATMFAWVAAVLFAYWTNRTFVFKSRVKDRQGIWKEFTAFVGARVVTGLLELLLMYVLVDLVDVDDMISKFICNVVVIASNYVFSKLWVFKKLDFQKKEIR
ncbi:MAG: GtrA family protein [Lachnospiraceae bacterium]|nr:GtrA family protein [Lachnospiraceae bacterium]